MTNHVKGRRLVPGVARCVWALLLSVVHARAAVTNDADICVYGGTSGGVVAAVQAARMGKRVALVVFNNHLGGMTSGGLGWTDYGNKGAIGGIALEFYQAVGAKYGSGNAAWTFEPHVAEAVFDELVAAYANIAVYTNQRLASVNMARTNIASITMEDGTTYTAGMFIDATYEGDLMAGAGVPYTVGREANAYYGESLNGVVNPAGATGTAVDPYAVPGDAGSGLLPYIQDGTVEPNGTADHRVQAYNYRICLTTVASNQLPITAPADYDRADYELLARYIAATNPTNLDNYIKVSPIPNGKTDINNGGFVSTDFIGMNWDYPEGDYAQREIIRQAHEDYNRGLLYYLGHETNVPQRVRDAMNAYGFCRDEFIDTGGWPHQLYVREARRMRSDYVMTEAHCRGTCEPYDGVGLGSYTMDSHACRRHVAAGHTVRSEGYIGTRVPGPYPIAYRAMTPPRGACGNLLVPWSLSATHVAFASIRMEPVFMILGQSAATAAAQALDAGVPVQDVSITNLQARLIADGQLIRWETSGNQRPYVELTTPRMNDVFPMGTNVLLGAEAWDPDGTVERVEFRANGYPIVAVTNPPFALAWSNTYPQEMTITARAYDDDGAVNESTVAHIRVGTTNDPGGAENGIIVDNADTPNVTLTGSWSASTAVTGYYGPNYIHDGNTNQGLKSVRFTPLLPITGDYNTFIRVSALENRSSVVPVDIVHADGTNTIVIDETDTRYNGQWLFAGRYRYVAGTTGSVLVRTDGANGYVTADAVSFANISTNIAPSYGTASLVEDFNDYGTNDLETLNGLNGGRGWGTPWTGNFPGAVGYNAGERTTYNVPDYDPADNRDAKDSGRAIILSTDTSSPVTWRGFATPLAGTVWIGCLVRHQDNAAGDMLLWLNTSTSGSGANTFVGLRNGDQATLRYGGNEIPGDELQSAGKNLLLLVKVVLDHTVNQDAVSFWIKTEQDDIRSETQLGPPLLSRSDADVLGGTLSFIGLSGGQRFANIDALRVSNRPTAFNDVVRPTTWPVRYATDFPEPEGAFPTDWEALIGAVGPTGWRIEDGDLRYDGSSTAGVTRYVGPLDDGGDSTGLADCMIDTIFRKSDTDVGGLVARLRGGTDFYHARVYNTSQLEIYRFAGGGNTRLASATLGTAYSGGQSWRLRLMCRGNTIITDAFDQNDALAGRVSAVDAAFTNGCTGCRGQSPAIYEVFSVSAPTPPPPRDGSLIIVR